MNTDDEGRELPNSVLSITDAVCPKCGAVGKTEMRNYSMMWHDGDIHCSVCGTFIRFWDAG